MKLKQLLGGVLAAALIVTSMPMTGLVAFAEMGALGPQHGIESSGYVYKRLTSKLEGGWEVTTDAGTSSGNITNIVKDDGNWTSNNAIKNTDSYQDNHPVKDITLSKNNNYYLKILNAPDGVDVGKLVYTSAIGGRNGKILNAKIYVSTDKVDVDTADEMKNLNWTEVARDSEKRSYTSQDISSYQEIPYVFDQKEENVRYVRMEALDTDARSVQPNTLISGYELELYKDTEGTMQIESSALAAYADFDTHKDGDLSPSKLLDGKKNESGVCNSMEWNNNYDVTENNYQRYPKQVGFIQNNNILIDIKESKPLAMLTYVAATLIGGIRDANIYLSNATEAPEMDQKSTLDINAEGTTEEQIEAETAEKWVKVYSGEEEWAKYLTSDEIFNNGHSVYWKPVEARHVRIEVGHTYGQNGGSASETANGNINVKRILLYEGVEAVDVVRATKEEDHAVEDTTIAAFSGYLSEQDKESNKVENVYDDNETGDGTEKHNHDTYWAAGPALKGDESNAIDVPYIVFDLGEHTRTLVDTYSIMWGNTHYATKYVVLTSDNLDPAIDIQSNSVLNEENHWSDKTLTDPPKLDGEGREVANLIYNTEKWQRLRVGNNESGGQETGSFDGVRPDNQYFNTENTEELKRYVCLVLLDMNQEAEEDGVAIKCISIGGEKRKVEPLESVTVTMTDPVPNSAPPVPSRTEDTFTVVNVKWTQDGSTQPMTGNFPAQEEMDNHVYTVEATLKPDAGYIFTENTKINHTLHTERDHIHKQELNSDDTLYVSHTFLREIDTAIIDATLPGGNEDVMDTLAPTSSDNDKYTVEKYEWLKEEAPVSTGKFTTGEQYKLRVTLAANKEKYYFKDPMSVTLAGQAATVSSNDNGRTLEATITFTPKEILKSVTPKVKAPNGTENSEQVEVGTSENEKYEVTETKWLYDSSQELSVGQPFVEGTAYTVEAVLKPKTNYSFADASDMLVWLEEKADSAVRYKATVENTDEGNIKVTYAFAASAGNVEDAKSKLQEELGKYGQLTQDDYTTVSWEPYQTAYTYADSVKDGNDENKINAAKDYLETYRNALKRKVTALPALSVDAPVYKGVQTSVQKAESEAISEVKTRWYKKSTDAYSAMAEGDKFGAGTYKLVVSLVPADTYGFENAELLQNLTVNGADEAKQITDAVVTEEGNLSGSCEFEVEIPCTCEIGDISLEILNGSYQPNRDNAFEIETGPTGRKDLTLSASAKVVGCEKPEHQSEQLSFSYALDGESDIASIEKEDLTLTGAGNVTVKVTASIDGNEENKKEKSFTFIVTNKEKLQKDLDDLHSAAAKAKETTDAEDADSKYTAASLQALRDAISAAEAITNISNPDRITTAAAALKAAMAGLKQKITKPTLTVDKPVAGGNTSDYTVTTTDEAPKYSIAQTWTKADGTEAGGTFEAGTYKLKVTLTPTEGYAFEEKTMPDSLSVKDGDSTKAEKITAQVTDEGTVTFELDIVACSCAIGAITVKADNLDSIVYEGEEKAVTLTAAATVTCADTVGHVGRTAVVTNMELTPGKDSNAAKSLTKEDNAWKLTVDKKGTAYVTVTMQVTEKPAITRTDNVEILVRDAEELLAALNQTITTAQAEQAKTDTYTAKSLAALGDAITAAQAVVSGSDHTSAVLAKAEADLNAAIGALKKKIAKPSLSVAKPVFDAAPADVTKKAANDNYTVTTEWSKVDGQTVTKLNPGDKFGEGTYRATVTLTPAEEYAFEDSTKPDSIAVNDETKTVVATLDEAAGSVTFTCDFTVTAPQAECTCAIENVSLKIDGEDTGVIYLNLKSSKTVALTAAVKVGEAKCAAHPDAAVTYTIAKKTDQSNIIQEIKQNSDSYSMTVAPADPENKGGEWTATVTVTATLSGKTKTKDVTFKVTKEDSSDYEALFEDLDGKVSDEVLNGYLNPGFADDARTNYLAEAEKKNHTDKTLQMLEDAITQGHAVRENTDATTGDVLSAADFFADVEGAALQEKKLAALKAEIEALDSTEYTAESWSAFQATLTAKNGEIEALQSDWTAENSQMTVEVYAAQMESLKEALTAARQALVKKGTTTPEDPDLTAAKEAVSNALAAAQDAYENADNQSRTDKAWTDFKAAYEAAKNAAADANAETLNGLAEALNAALQTLNNTPVNPPVDPEIEEAEKALQKALEDMQDILGAGQSNYSDETWEAFRQAYLKARDHAPGMTAEELKNLLRELNEAKAALAENKQPTDEKKPQPNQGGQKPPTGDNLPKAGTQYTVGKLVYQVKTSTATDKTVMVMNATSKTQKKITIPATVTIGGQAYKVVEIKANAFAKNKKLTTVTIGKNVTKIGKKAFLGCAKLKKITIKAAGLKTIGKQAFAKINKKAKIKVPKKQLKTLKKKLKKAKTIKSAKITK